MARWLGIVSISAALVGCGASSASPRGGHTRAASARCGPRDGKTLAADRFVRVYVKGGLVYGCLVGSGRRYELGQRGRLGGGSVGLVKVAGKVVAYAVEVHGVDTASGSVAVRRLTDGRQLHQDRATIGPLGPESFQSVDALVVRPSGGVAWIGSASSIVRHGRQIQVIRHDRRGAKQLDAGASIGLRSLRLHGSTLRWTHGGAMRRAKLF